MKLNSDDVVKNLSSRKLWTIIEKPFTDIEEQLINEAKIELKRRNQFSDTEKYQAPH